MSTLIDSIKSAQHINGTMVIQMESGVEIRFPVSRNTRLRNGTDHQLDNVEISAFGLHWPELDEDLSIRGLVSGDYGQQEDCQTPR